MSVIISLVGMSNIGKTYWAKRLEAAGFKLFSCDDYIEKRLERILKYFGLCGTKGLAKWMGHPFDRQYSETSKQYLELERESLENIIQHLYHNGDYKNIVIDTTSSIVHIKGKIMDELSKLTTIIYLDVPAEVREEMCKLYFKNPKPVIWGDNYKKLYGESSISALKRCYPYLLKYRCQKYKEYAHIILDYFLLRKNGFTTEDFLGLLQREDDFVSEYQRQLQIL